MSNDEQSRLQMELQLLEAMYPDQTRFDSRSRDLKFIDSSAVLELRIPESYPEAGLPDVISASDAIKNDLRNQMKATVNDLGLAEGEEALDAIIASFQSLIASTNQTEDSHADTVTSSHPEPEVNKTVIIWLHHLLALTKRKLATSPPPSVSGVTKPGYPGIMLFSGLSTAVDGHVNTLKAQNWQAFQVRYEEGVLWEMGGASGAVKGVKEVETMAEVVNLVGKERKEEFLKAVGIK